MRGEVEQVEADWRFQIATKQNIVVRADKWKAVLPNMYVWCDFFSIPQPMAGPLTVDLIPQETALANEYGSFLGSFKQSIVRTLSAKKDRVTKKETEETEETEGAEGAEGTEGVERGGVTSCSPIETAARGGCDYDGGSDGLRETKNAGESPQTSSYHHLSPATAKGSDEDAPTENSVTQAVAVAATQASPSPPAPPPTYPDEPRVKGGDDDEWETILRFWLNKAVESISAYIERSTLVIVLVPSSQHVDRTEICDHSNWRRRGWCRFEFIGSVLARTDVHLMRIEGTHACPEFIFPADALHLAPGERKNRENEPCSV
jgi:hypothetical protein